MKWLLALLTVAVLLIVFYLVWTRTAPSSGSGNASEIVVVPTTDWWGPRYWPGGHGWWPHRRLGPGGLPPQRHPLGPGGQHMPHPLGPGGLSPQRHPLGPGGQQHLLG
jgi:hypothetical protein